MSSVELVRQYYQFFNEKNWAGMLSLLDAEVIHGVNQGETYSGIERFRDFLQHMEHCYEETITDLVVMHDETGERIACEFVVQGVYKQTDGDLPPARNQRYDLPAGAFLEVKNGKILRVTTYYNLPLWIQLVS